MKEENKLQKYQKIEKIYETKKKKGKMGDNVGKVTNAYSPWHRNLRENEEGGEDYLEYKGQEVFSK